MSLTSPAQLSQRTDDAQAEGRKRTKNLDKFTFREIRRRIKSVRCVEEHSYVKINSLKYYHIPIYILQLL